MNYFPFEIIFSQTIQSQQNSILTLFFTIITQVGNPVIWLLISAGFYWRGEERNSFFLMTTILISSVTIGLLKPLIARLRPSTKIVKVFFIETDSIYGFPSGHSTIIASIYSFYEKHLKKKQKIIFITLVLLVLVSRIYLGAHYLLDVLAGLFLGLILGKTIYLIQKKYKKTELHSKKLIEKTGLLASIILLLIIFIIEQHPIATLLLGYFIGIFLYKLLGFDSKQLIGKKLIIKETIGFITLGILLSTHFYFNETIQRITFLTAGLFISLIYPIIWEKITND